MNIFQDLFFLFCQGFYQYFLQVFLNVFKCNHVNAIVGSEVSVQILFFCFQNAFLQKSSQSNWMWKQPVVSYISFKPSSSHSHLTSWSTEKTLDYQININHSYLPQSDTWHKQTELFLLIVWSVFFYSSNNEMSEKIIGVRVCATSTKTSTKTVSDMIGSFCLNHIFWQLQSLLQWIFLLFCISLPFRQRKVILLFTL